MYIHTRIYVDIPLTCMGHMSGQYIYIAYIRGFIYIYVCRIHVAHLYMSHTSGSCIYIYMEHVFCLYILAANTSRICGSCIHMAHMWYTIFYNLYSLEAASVPGGLAPADLVLLIPVWESVPSNSHSNPFWFLVLNSVPQLHGIMCRRVG